jgi:membrane protease subunit HflK
MSDHDHEHHDPGHSHESAPVPPLIPDDAGSQALSEALKSSFAIVKVVMGILLVLFLGSGFFTVRSQEKAVILRLGRPVGEGSKALLGAGAHWAFPYPIDEVVKIPITELQTVESTVGWYFLTPEQKFTGIDPPYVPPSLNPAIDGYTITGDTNIIHTRATLTYRIDDPVHFAFDFVSAPNAVQDALDNALIYASARFAVDDVLTRDRTRFQEVVQARVTDLVRQEKLGIVVDQCSVVSIPPRQCKDAFDAVLTAVSTRDTVHNDALKYENEVVTKAEAESANRTNVAETERVRLVSSVRAEADRFSALLPKYQANPSLFVNLLLSKEIGRVLTNVEDKIYLPERADGKTRELRLQLSREPLAPAAEPGNP